MGLDSDDIAAVMRGERALVRRVTRRGPPLALCKGAHHGPVSPR